MSHPLPGRTELGGEVPPHGVTRLEKWRFPLSLPALPGNKLEPSDLCSRLPGVMYGPESGESPLSLGRLPILFGRRRPLHPSPSPWRRLLAPKVEPAPWPAARWLLTLTHALMPSLPSFLLVLPLNHCSQALLCSRSDFIPLGHAGEEHREKFPEAGNPVTSQRHSLEELSNPLLPTPMLSPQGFSLSRNSLRQE